MESSPTGIRRRMGFVAPQRRPLVLSCPRKSQRENADAFCYWDTGLRNLALKPLEKNSKMKVSASSYRSMTKACFLRSRSSQPVGCYRSRAGRLVELCMGRSKACRRIPDRLGGGFTREVEGECARDEWRLASGMERGNTTPRLILGLDSSHRVQSASFGLSGACYAVQHPCRA